MSNLQEHSWRSWRFDKMPKSALGDDLYSLIYFLEMRLGIESVSDWGKVSSGHIEHGRQLIERYGGLLEALKFVYPNESFATTAYKGRLFPLSSL